MSPTQGAHPPEPARDRLPVDAVPSLDARVAEALEHVAGAFVILDRTWRFTFVNRNAVRPIDLEPGDVVGRNLWELFPEFRGTATARHYQEVMDERRPSEFDDRSPVNGRWYEISVYPVPEGIAAHWHDVTDRKLAEVALRESEERLRLTAEAGQTGLFDWDPKTNRMYWSDQNFRTLGLAPGEVEPTYSAWAARVHPDDLPGVEALVQASQAARRPYHGVHRVVWPDGSIHVMEARAQFSFDEAGACTRMRGTYVDITERTLEHQVNERLRADIEVRQRLEEERAQLMRQLVIAQEAERGRVARELHDGLGQHLTALRFHIESLMSHASGPPAVRSVLERMQTLARTLDGEVNRIAADLRPAALDDLGLEDALHRHVQLWSKEVGVPADIHTRGLESRFGQVLETTVYRVVQEALTNVRKHARATRISVVVERRDGQLVVAIEDDGVGFGAAAPGGRTPASGFGLSTMRERAALVDGELQVESHPSTGTTVYLRIPIGG